MDVPKITVFKSPPWHKPVPQLQMPKLSDVYEEFPVKSKMLPRRLNMGMSRSLECIPENTILHDTHKYSTVHLRDNNRLSPHQILPPISQIGEDDLPEMRQRAYSDPHKYSARRKSMDDKKESPLTRSIAVPQPSPPVKEKPSDIQCNTVLTPDNKAQNRRTTNHKENTATRTPTSPNKAPSSPAGLARVGNASPMSSKPPRANAIPPLRRKITDSTNSHSNPSTPEGLNRVGRNRKFVNRNLSGDNVITHPSVAALKDGSVSQSRLRTNSLPTSLNEPKTRRRSTNSQPDIQTKPKDEGLKSTVAYALIGSPGRSRWPSPDRQTTSYIHSEEESPIETPPECLSDTENQHDMCPQYHNDVQIHRLTPKLDNNASSEFKAILRDFKSTTPNSAGNKLNSISDPAEYFQKARRLEKPQW